MGIKRFRQILLFIIAFSFLRGLQLGFLSGEDSFTMGYIGIGIGLLPDKKSDASALDTTTTTIPFSEVRKIQN